MGRGLYFSTCRRLFQPSGMSRWSSRTGEPHFAEAPLLHVALREDSPGDYKLLQPLSEERVLILFLAEGDLAPSLRAPTPLPPSSSAG